MLHAQYWEGGQARYNKSGEQKRNNTGGSQAFATSPSEQQKTSFLGTFSGRK